MLLYVLDLGAIVVNFCRKDIDVAIDGVYLVELTHNVEIAKHAGYYYANDASHDPHKVSHCYAGHRGIGEVFNFIFHRSSYLLSSNGPSKLVWSRVM